MNPQKKTPQGFPGETISRPLLVPQVRVAIIEDQREIREGLGILIGGTDGYRCMGTYRSMEEALAGIDQNRPDLVLVDIGLPGMSGIDGIRILKERYPLLLPLVLTVYEDDERIFEALCAGACGYLLKKTPPARLLEYLREAVGGGAPISPEVARRVIALFRQFPTQAPADYELTPHESRAGLQGAGIVSSLTFSLA